MNNNFGGVLEVLRREYQGGTPRTGGTDDPPTVATVMAYSSKAGSGPDLRGGGAKKYRKSREKRDKRRE